MSHRQGFLLFCFLTSIFSMVSTGIVEADTLKAPSETLSVQSFNEGEMSVDVQGWYCTDILEAYAREAKALIKEIKEKKASGQDAMEPKKRLFSMAKALIEMKDQDALNFWKEYKSNRKGIWTWKAKVEPGHSKELSEEGCYTLDELERAKNNSLSWADYVIKFYGYLEN